MMRARAKWFIHFWLIALTSAAVGCSDNGGGSTGGSGGAGGSGGGSVPLPVTIEFQDDIVSEDGMLELLSGQLRIVSVRLVREDGAVPMLGPTTLDLLPDEQDVQISTPVEPGSYTGLEVELAPATEGELMLDTEIRAVTTQETIRAISELSISGTISFPEGPRAITEESTVSLHLSLRGMFFYLSPITGAVDGVYDMGENLRDFVTMDLVGMFDLRILP